MSGAVVRLLCHARPASAVALVTLTLLWTPSALAGRHGTIHGTVVDEADAPVPYVRVLLRSTALMRGERRTRTDDRGRFRFSGLPPGRYDVMLAHDRQMPLTEMNLQVRVGSVVHRTYRLRPGPGLPGAADEQQAPPPIVDVSRVSTGMHFDSELTDRIVTPRSYQGVAQLAPGAVDSWQVPGDPSFHGASGFSNAYYVDGVLVRDPVTRRRAAHLPFDAIEEMHVMTGGLDAEYGDATGGAVELVTKSGSNTFDFDSSIYYAPGFLKLLDEGERSDGRDVQANVSVGGPILPRRLWFFAAAQYLDRVDTISNSEPAFTGIPFLPPRTERAASLLGKLTFEPVPWQQLQLSLIADPSWLTHTQQQADRHPSAERQQYEGGMKASLSSETRFAETAFWRTQLSYTNNRTEVFPVSNDRDTPGHVNSDTGAKTVNDTLIIDDTRSRAMAETDLTYHLDDLLGDHVLKLGLEGQVVWNSLHEDRVGSAVFVDRGLDSEGKPLAGEGDSYRLERVIDPLDKFLWGNGVGAYVQDMWHLFDAVTFRPGLRFDSVRAYLDPLDGGDEIYQLHWASPRFGAVWDPFGDGKMAVRGGYFMYADMGSLGLARGAGRGLEVDVFEFNPATGNYDRYIGQQQRSSPVAVDDEIAPPLLHEVIIGFSRELGTGAALHADVVFRRKNNIFETEETNVQWNSAGDDAVGFSDGEDGPRLQLTTPPEAFQQYIGLDLALEKRLSDNWSLLATYTLSRLEGTVEDAPGYALDNPRQAPFEFGFLKNDVRHNAKLHLTYELPYGLVAGASAMYLSGRPYDKLYYNAVYDDYTDRRARRGYAPKEVSGTDDEVELRLPDQLTVNARLAWRLLELTDQDIWIVGELRNVLNQRPAQTLEERDLGSGAFGATTSRSEPMGATLGLRYRF